MWDREWPHYWYDYIRPWMPRLFPTLPGRIRYMDVLWGANKAHVASGTMKVSPDWEIGRYFLGLGIFTYSYHLVEQWRSAQLVWLSNAWEIFIMDWRKQRIIKVIINNEIGKIWKFLWKYTQVLVTNRSEVWGRKKAVRAAAIITSGPGECGLIWTIWTASGSIFKERNID